MSDLNIGLVGFRGTGKSTLGRKLAKRLSMDFIDTDKEIEKKSGLSIMDFFERHGEDEFRKAEEKAVEEACAKSNTCISFGGGAVISEKNRVLIKKSCVVILLIAEEQFIFERIFNDKNRPKLTKADFRNEISLLLKRRENFYSELADITFNTSKSSIMDSVQQIIDELNEKGYL